MGRPAGCTARQIGARAVEMAARIRIHFASAYQDAPLFRMLADRLAVSGP